MMAESIYQCAKMGIYAVQGGLMLCICMILDARDILSICTMEAGS